MRHQLCVIAALVSLSGTTIDAEEPRAVAEVSFTVNGQDIRITQTLPLDPTFAVANGAEVDCDGICIAPMALAEGVQTIAEAEVLEFITKTVATGQGLLLDSRTPDNRPDGTIAGSVMLPASILDEANPYRRDILLALGARELDGTLDFAHALPIMIFDGGPLDDDAALLVTTLLGLGYPADRIQYYRGGTQVWATLGLSLEGAAS